MCPPESICYPKISIVVPNYNGGRTLARTLDSLFAQQYPALEIIVVDGGSTDNSVEILCGVASRLAWWVSERDQGQADAINKGMQHATGSIVNWLCSDDVLEPDALFTVARFFGEHPHVDMLVGSCRLIYEREPSRNVVFVPEENPLHWMPIFNGIMQPSCFWRTRLHTRLPLLDARYHFALDNELWCYFKSQNAQAAVTPCVLSSFIQDGNNKTSSGGRRIASELDRLYRTYKQERVPLSFWYLHFRHPFEAFIRRDRGSLRRVLLAFFQVTWMVLLAPFYGWSAVRKISWPA